MTLKEQMVADVAVFFNEDEFAESVTYNGASILSIPEIGETDKDGNEYSSEGSADRASFSVKVSDIPLPISQDKIIHNGKSWYVVRLLESDGVTHRVQAIAAETPFPVRWG